MVHFWSSIIFTFAKQSCQSSNLTVKPTMGMIKNMFMFHYTKKHLPCIYITLPKTGIVPKNDGFQVRNLQKSRGPLFSVAFAASFRESGNPYDIPIPCDPLFPSTPPRTSWASIPPWIHRAAETSSHAAA